MGAHEIKHEEKRESAAAPVRRRRRKPLFLLWLIPLLAILAGAGLILSRFAVSGGALVRRDAAEVDLREKTLSCAQYDRLAEKLPDCHIRWSVPIGAERFDSLAETVTPAALGDADIENLVRFENLRELDLRSADISAEQFERARALLPGVHIAWSIPIGAARYDSTASAVTLANFSAEETAKFSYFEQLQRADASSCDCYDALLSLREAGLVPELCYTVPIAGESWLHDSRDITLNGAQTDGAELSAKLAYLPEAETVTITDCRLSPEEQLALRERYPDIRFAWTVELCGKTFRSEDTTVSLAGQKLGADKLGEIMAKAGLFPALERIDLSGCGLKNEELKKLADACPGVDVLWDLTVCGVETNSLVEELDLTGAVMESTAEIEDMLQYLPKLRKVDMTDCGFSDEEMDALNKRYDDIRFVWTMYITNYVIRTDDTSFIACLDRYSYFTDETVMKLAYCPDMICLDLGHRQIANLNFLYAMPHLKYLILADCRAEDLSPLADAPELIYLELNRGTCTDIKPLANCKKLEHVNITFNPFDRDEVLDTFLKMPQLKRVWISRLQLLPEQEQQLREANPDLKIGIAYEADEATGGDWRYDRVYYDMRDALGMYYMNAENNEINYKHYDGKYIYPGDPEW